MTGKPPGYHGEAIGVRKVDPPIIGGPTAEFIRTLASFTIEGEDLDGEPYWPSFEDLIETMTWAIETARKLQAGS